MKRFALFLLPIVAGCAQMSDLWSSRPGGGGPAPEETTAVVGAPPPPARARTAEQFDTTTEAQRAAATAVTPAAEEALGQVVVSLGDPAQAGLWLETSLVDAPRSGRVVAPDGTDALIELRPGAGGARMSLAAMRLLGLGLTDLPTVAVYAR